MLKSTSKYCENLPVQEKKIVVWLRKKGRKYVAREAKLRKERDANDVIIL